MTRFVPLFLFCNFFFLSHNLVAQRFNFGLIGGINLSELTGEDVSSYVGWNTGIKGTATLSNRYRLSTEILFSQAGEFVQPVYFPPINYGRIRLDYLEIPIYFSAMAFPVEGHFQKEFSLGCSFVRLINHQVSDANGFDVSDQIIWDSRTGLIGHLGVSHHFNQHMGLNFRAALGRSSSIWAWTLSFRGIYTVGS